MSPPAVSSYILGSSTTAAMSASLPPDLFTSGQRPMSSSPERSPTEISLPTTDGGRAGNTNSQSAAASTVSSSTYTQPSQHNLRQRRHDLQRQRQVRVWQRFCRWSIVTGLAAATVTISTSPRWQIHTAEQVNLSGHQLLSDEALHEMLALDYPQPLLKLQPEALEQHLLEQGPIASAVVSRRLFPPGLNVRVQERHPVAVVLPDTRTPVTSVNAIQPFSQKGLLDESGYWMPYQSFSQIADSFTLPDLQIEGMQPAYQPHWPRLYAQIKDSPVVIYSLDWRSPDNLILHTELGTVHLGPYSNAVPSQLAALDKMRNLPTQLEVENIAFIDLRNPDYPAIEILQATGQP